MHCASYVLFAGNRILCQPSSPSPIRVGQAVQTQSKMKRDFSFGEATKYINSIQINWPSDVTQKWRAKELNVIFISFRMKSGYSWARRHTKSSHQMSEYSQFGERKSCKCALVTSWHSWIKIQNLIFYFSYFKIFNLVAFIAEIWSWMN